MVTVVNKHLYINGFDISYRGCEYMHSNRALRATLISIILVLGSLLPALIIVPTVGADSISGETTFYFKNALNLEFEDGLGLGIVPVTQDEPTKQNDSEYPPSIFSKNTSKLLPRYKLNSDEMLTWITAWALYLMPEFGDNSSGGIDDWFEGFELLLPHPFRVVEIYEYDGNESVEVGGDVVFDLYFSSHPLQRRRPKFRDEVVIGLYSMDYESLLPLPKLIKNTTNQIKSNLLKEICKQQITLENVTHTIDPGETLLFSIEIVPSEKPISNIITRERTFLKKIGEGIVNWLEQQENNSERPTLQKVGEFIKEVRYLIEGINITEDDIAEFVNLIRSSSFVYDSVAHPSSVTMEFRLPDEGENIKVYYLHDENKMNINEPTGSTSLKQQLSDSHVEWNGSALDERNKIIKKVSVDLYLQYLNILTPGRAQVGVTLFDGSTEITDPSLKALDSSSLLAQIPTTFTFENVNHELLYGHGLSMEVFLANGSKPGLLRKVSLLYDSSEKPSSVKVIFGETDNIKFDYVADPEDGLIIPGGSVKYTLNIASEYDDKISVDVLEDKEGDWDVTIIEDQIDISTGGTAEVHIFINSTENKKKAYSDTIDMTFVVSGKTGIDRQTASAEVSEDAIEYDVNIVVSTESKNIKKGNNGTFYFIIENNNTGAVDDVDSYTITASSENNWEIKHTDLIKNLEIENKTGPEEIKVIVSVPKNTSLESDIITFTVTSDSNSETFATINVTVNVLGPSILESIYEFFESASNTLGLDEMFGSYAPIALASILMIIVLFIIIILALLLTRKSVKIICTERIKEIDPDDEATFEIIIQNPTRKTKTYEISSNENSSSPKWEKSIETEKITIDARQSKTVFLAVKPTEFAEPDDWTETKVKVNILGKQKSEEITIMTMVKNGKTLLKITNVFTWPKEFKKGDRIITSFKLENKGNITARNVNAVLYLNNKEKNKVEVTIPIGGYADIRMPWIAIKGKNKLHIKAIEQ